MCMRSYNGDDRKSYALEAEASASCSLAFIAFFHLRSARQVESNKHSRGARADVRNRFRPFWKQLWNTCSVIEAIISIIVSSLDRDRAQSGSKDQQTVRGTVDAEKRKASEQKTQKR